MKNRITTLLITSLTLCSIVFARPFPPKKGESILSLGGGIGPSVVLMTGQLEFAQSEDLYLGPLVQTGFGSGMLLAISGGARYVMGRKLGVIPTVEGGIGALIASGMFDGSLGVNLHLGLGFDYLIKREMAIGTVFRMNFAPPLKSSYLMWQIIAFRFVL